MKRGWGRLFGGTYLLVYVQPGGWRWPLLIPLPLAVVEDALDAALALIRLASWLGLRRARRACWNLAGPMIHALRSRGPFTLVEVQASDARVKVRVI